MAEAPSFPFGSNHRLRVLLACGEPHCALEEMIARTTGDVAVCYSARELINRAISERPDLIITVVDLPDMDGVSALVEISNTVSIPAIVVTPRTSLEIVERAMLDHVMAYLVEPVEEAEIRPTVHLVLRRFEQFQEMQAEVDSLRQALADRKVIERAKGVLMRRENLDEDAAYKQLRRAATDGRIRLIEVARKVLADDEEKATKV
jgi:response regulator NasT